MANAKKCDRCGNFYDFYSGVEFTPSGNRYVSVALEGTNGSNPKYFDLCEDCLRQLIYFLQSNSGYDFFQCRNCKHERNNIHTAPCVSCKRVNSDPAYKIDYYEFHEE